MVYKYNLLIYGTVCWCSAGREQAELTGQRLAALGLKYDIMVYSTMARATETANIISKYLPGQNPRQADFTAEPYARVYTIFRDMLVWFHKTNQCCTASI